MEWLLHARVLLGLVAGICLLLGLSHTRQWKTRGVGYLNLTLLGAALQQIWLALFVFLQNIGVIQMTLAVNYTLGFVAQLFVGIPAVLFVLYVFGILNNE